MKTIEIIEAGEEMKTLETITFTDECVSEKEIDLLSAYYEREAISYTMNFANGVKMKDFRYIGEVKNSQIEGVVIILKPE